MVGKRSRKSWQASRPGGSTPLPSADPAATSPRPRPSVPVRTGTIPVMIDPRLQAVLDESGPPAAAPLHIEVNDAPAVEPVHPCRVSSAARPSAAPSAELRAQMRAEVPGRDKAPAGPHRNIAEWLTADADTAAPVTETSPWFTISHWHWLAAKGMVRHLPAEMGPTFPHLFLSEAQIIHDLTAWSALDVRRRITPEAEEMFGAVSGAAEMTLYGTVLLYAHRRAPVTLPAELKEFGLEAAVRNVPRVSFAIGLTERETVTALVNNLSVVFTRQLRRGDAADDAAGALLRLLDPEGNWPTYPLSTPITLPAEVAEQLATSEETSGVIDSEPSEDATEKERADDLEKRKRIVSGARKVLRGARIPSGSAEVIADIAGSTTDALAQVTLRTRDVDVSRGEPGALAINFLRNKGAVASYPSGNGQFRRILFVSGNLSGISTGIATLRRGFTGG